MVELWLAAPGERLKLVSRRFHDMMGGKTSAGAGEEAHKEFKVIK